MTRTKASPPPVMLEETRIRTRRVGLLIDGSVLEAKMAERGLEARDLARLAGVAEDTLIQARNGRRIKRDTLLKISDALLKVPVHPMAAALTRKVPA